MTDRRYQLARADAVQEIIEHEGGDSEALPMAVNRARNAILAGESAHRALEIARDWIREWPGIASPISMLRQHAFEIVGTRVESVTTDSRGVVEAELYSYRIGGLVRLRLELEHEPAVVLMREAT